MMPCLRKRNWLLRQIGFKGYARLLRQCRIEVHRPRDERHQVNVLPQCPIYAAFRLGDLGHRVDHLQHCGDLVRDSLGERALQNDVPKRRSLCRCHEPRQGRPEVVRYVVCQRPKSGHRLFVFFSHPVERVLHRRNFPSACRGLDSCRIIAICNSLGCYYEISQRCRELSYRSMV